MTSTNTATTWRAYADQLTTEQINELACLAGRLATAPADVVTRLLADRARQFAQERRVEAALAHIPAPACERVGAWEPEDSGGYSRGLIWSERNLDAAAVTVTVDGRQDSDGRIQRALSLYAGDGVAELTAAEARGAARLLMAAAEELDRLGDLDAARQAQDDADAAWSAVPVDS